MCPNAELLKLQHWGVMQGIGLAQNLWERAPGNVTGKQWIPRLKVWHPRMLYYRLDAEELIVHTRDGDRVVESGDGEWVVYAPYGLHRGWMYGKIRSLYVPWLVRQWGWRDWARHSEVHGMPIRKAITPTSADEKDKQRFLKEVARLGSENVIRLPKALDGSQFDLELLEAAADGHLVFKELLAEANSSVAIALLGQNLTTEVKAGSFAAAQVHQNIRSDILRGDAQNLGLMLREQVLKPWARFNFGDAELAPTPTWSTDPPEDKGALGTAMVNIGKGLQELRKAGAKPDTDSILENAGMEVTGPAEEPPPPEAQPSGPGGPQNGGEPGATQPEAQADSKRLATLLEATKPSPEVEGQLYADDLVRNGRHDASRALLPDLQDLLEAVHQARNFEELRTLLESTYDGLKGREELARAMQRALVLAELAGRHAILEGV
jgi:phage gp29-like protein